MHEHKNIQFDDLAHVLHNAHLRRSADFGHWLRRYLEGRRQAEPTIGAKPHLLNTIISLVVPPRQKAI